MRVVVRNPKHEKRHLWGFYQPETFTYEGEPVPAYKWSEPGTICLTTGDSRWPVREIHPSNIISIDDQPQEQPLAQDRDQTILIPGSRGETYTVTLGKSTTCTCSGFQFRKSCKHLAMAQNSSGAARAKISAQP